MNFKFFFFFSLIYLQFFLSCKTKHSTTDLTERQMLENTTKMIEAFEQIITGNDKKALQICHQIIQNNPSHDASRFLAARILKNQYQYSQAIEYLQQAIKSAPNNIWYIYFLIDLYKKTGEHKKTIHLYEQLIKQAEKDLNLYLELSLAYLQQHDIKNAIRVLDEFEKKFGLYEELIIQKYKYYLISGNQHKAIEELQKFEIIDPYNIEYLLTIGKHYLQIGLIPKATEYFERILLVDQQNIEAISHLLNAYLILNNQIKFEEVIIHTIKNKLISIDNKIKLLIDLYHLTNSQNKLLSVIYQALELLIQIYKDEPKAYSMYGDFLFRDEKFDLSAEFYKKVISLVPSKYQVWENLLICYEELELWDSVLTYSLNATELFPEHYKFYLYVGFAYYQNKQYNNAIPFLEKANSLNMSDNQVKFFSNFLLAETYYKTSQYDQSFTLFEKIIEEYPTNYTVLNNFSYYLAVQKRDLEKAIKYSEKTIKANPKNPYYLSTYGWILYQMGKYSEAEKYFHRSVEYLDKPNAEIFEQYGDVLLKLDRTEEAVQYWQKALQNAEKKDEIEKKLQMYEKK